MSLIKVNNLATLDGASNREVVANTGLTIPVGEDLKVSGSIIDSTGSDGNTGQYLTAVNGGSQVSWTSLPQSISPTSNVTFASIIVTGDITINGQANFNLSALTTSDLTEGSNLYYTNTRARGAISAQNSATGDGSISYVSNTGVITYTGPVVADYRVAISATNSATGVGSITYVSNTGVLTYTGPNATNYRAAISATNSGSGDGSIAYADNTGVITYTGPSATTYRSAFSAANTPDTTSIDYLGNLSYNATIGRYTYTGPTTQEIRTKFTRRNVSGLGSIGYDSAIGEISYVGPSNAEIRNLFSAGGDLAYNALTGQFSVDLATSGGSDILDIVSNGPLTDLIVNNASTGKVITTAVVAGNVATVSSVDHGFIAGDRISISGNSSPHLNKIFLVATATTNSFTIAVSGVTSATYTGGLIKPVAVFNGDVVIDGTINVNGTNIGLSDLFVGTSLIKLNADLPDSSTPSTDGDDDAYIQVNRGIYNDTALRWNELSRRWQFTNDGVNFNNILLPSEADFGASEEFGASGDPNRYNVSAITNVVEGAFTYKKVTVPDITKFKQSHRIKVFGVSKTQSLASSNPTPSASSAVVASYESVTFSNIVDFPHQFYVYATAQMDLSNGDISAAIPQSVSAIENINVNDLNGSNYNTIGLTRTSNKAILVYRALFSDLSSANTARTNFTPNASAFKLISVVGPRYFGGNSNYQYVDYGAYDVTKNSLRDSNGDFGPNSIHVPHTAPTVAKQGFITCGIKPGSIDEITNTFILEEPTLYNDSNLSNIFLYHDDTVALQTAINDSVTNNRRFLVISGGTYLISQLELPDRFTLRGLSDATILHRQYWDTSKILNNNKSGVKGSMLVGAKYNATIPAINPSTGANSWGVVDNCLGDIIFDGSCKYQILNETSPLGSEANDAVINVVNSEFFRIQNVKVRQSAGPALYATGSTNLTVDGSIFYDGADLERFETQCVIAEAGDTTVITNSIFRDFPGPLNLSSTNVLSVNGCTIRNCGSGLRIYGSSKTDVLNNLILGPADEYIPVPDFYDSEFNSVNLALQYDTNNQTPVFQYLVSGQAVDLSNAVKRVETFRVFDVAGAESIDYANPITAADNSDLFTVINPGSLYDPSLGQVQFEISISNTNYLILNYPSGKTLVTLNQSGNPTATFDPLIASSYNVYRVYAIKYFDYGSDLSSSITTGSTVTISGIQKAYVLNVKQIAYDSVIVGSYIKLVSHSYNPQPAVGDRVWYVQGKNNVGGGNYTLNLLPYTEDAFGNLTASTLTGVGAEPTVGGGYIQVRDKFIIAKGVVGVSL